MASSAQDGPPRTLFDLDPFTGFGPSRFRPADEDATGHSVRGRGEKALRRGVRDLAPKIPGVYGMLDAKGRVVYIGKAKCLRSRLMSYFREGRDPKAGRILSHTRTLVWEHAHDELAALLRELELIRRFRPRFNVIGQPGPRRYVYLCLGKSPAAYAYFSREPTGKEVACYGPFVGRGMAEDAVRRLNDWFRLRDCPSTVPLVFADQPELFPEDRSPKCLRYDLGTCAGPCAGACSRAEYAAHVRAAKAFLDGRDKAVLREMTARMTTAAAELKFEQATAMRDRLQCLTWLSDRLTFLRSARKGGSFVYPLTGHDGRTVWYLIHRGEVTGVVREPTCRVTHAATLATIEAAFAAPIPDHGLMGSIVDSVLLVHGWFRKYTSEKSRLMVLTDVLQFTSAPQPASSPAE